MCAERVSSGDSGSSGEALQTGETLRTREAVGSNCVQGMRFGQAAAFWPEC